jgi:hypothetical protein
MAVERKIVWADDTLSCAGCGRAPYTRRDGRKFLYRYRAEGPAVCSLGCDRKCAEASRAEGRP